MERPSPDVLHVLAGPTASGKSAAALAWAERHGGVVVSADALQVYRGLDIGTAKPTPAERERVPHVGLDFLDPAEHGSVGRWIAEVAPRLDALREAGIPVLVAGGSGLYLKACFGPVTDDVVIPDAVRAEVDALERDSGLPGLRRRLEELHPDPTRPHGVDLANPRRVAAALARCLATGLDVPALRARFAAQPRPFGDRPVHAVLIARSRSDLAVRIESRTHAMIEVGLVDEVRRHEAALRANPTAGTAIGYRETLAFLAGGPEAPADLAALAALITRNTRALVRRQETWLRHQVRFDVTLTPEPGTAAALP